MARLVVLCLIISTAFAASSGVQELKKLIAAAQAAGDTDNLSAHKVSQFRLRERLTDEDLADLRALSLGPRTAAMFELLVILSAFEAAPEPAGATPLTPTETEAVLGKARNFTANYLHNLPNFICTRVIRRFDTRPIELTDNATLLGALRLQDTISSEVSFDRGKESYASQTVNGQPHPEPMQGLTTWGEFGGILGTLLGADPRTEWNRWEMDGRKPVAVFRYFVDRSHSQYTVDWFDDKHDPKRMAPGYNGEVTIDPSTGSIVRITRHAVLPRDAPMNFVDTMVEFQPVEIAGTFYICPVKSVTRARSWWNTRAGGYEFSLSEVRFGAYHKFAGSSTLLTADAPPEPDVPAPVPAPPPPTEPAPVIANPSPDLLNLPLPSPEVVLRSVTRMVEASAVVVDKNGKPVTDLKKEDFEIYDDGKRQTILLFSSSVTTDQVSSDPPPPEAAAPLSPRIFSNHAKETSHPLAPTIILFDEAAGSREQKFFARDQLLRFLNQSPPGEPIGLYVPIQSGVGVVDEFKPDSSDLRKILQEWNSGTRSFQSLTLPGHADLGPGTSLSHGIFDPNHCFATRALTAITAGADHVAEIPGRKIMIWYTLGGVTGNCFKQETEAEQALHKANVALYVIDARGLQSIQPDASLSQEDFGCHAASGLGCSAASVTQALSGMALTKLHSIDADQQLLLDMAEKAGGRAFMNNDLSGALRAPFTDSHATYSLGFYPESPKLDGKYHELVVKVPGRPGLTVRYRRGYVDESPDPKAQLRTALWNLLDATQIALTAEALPAKPDVYDVKLSIGADNLDRQGRIHVIMAQQDENGQEYDYRDDTLQLDLKPDSRQVSYHLTVPRNPKAASLRVVVRDEGGNLGSLIIR